MKETILISGGSGMIGSHLTGLLMKEGYDVIHLSRTRRGNRVAAFLWDVEKGEIEEEAVEKADHIIHLAGANLADGRWTDQRKQELIDSRVKSAGLLYRVAEKKGGNLKSFQSVSAIGFYGHRPGEVLKEEDPAGDSFVCKLCESWEEAALQFRKLGKRVAIYRLGLVLSEKDGILPQVVQPMNFGMAGYFGTGNAVYSWVHIDDVCQFIFRGLNETAQKGIFNLVADNPHPNKEFVKIIRNALNKQALLIPAPRFALRIVLGEMANTLFYSQYVSNEKARKSGFSFKFTELKKAVKEAYI